MSPDRQLRLATGQTAALSPPLYEVEGRPTWGSLRITYASYPPVYLTWASTRGEPYGHLVPASPCCGAETDFDEQYHIRCLQCGAPVAGLTVDNSLMMAFDGGANALPHPDEALPILEQWLALTLGVLPAALLAEDLYEALAEVAGRIVAEGLLGDYTTGDGRIAFR